MDKMTAKPVVGVSTRHTLIGAFQNTSGSPRAYTNLILECGGIPMMLPILGPLRSREELFSAVDGMLSTLDMLLIIGGKDFNPKVYGQQPHPKLDETDDIRDEFDIALVLRAYERRLPMFGICRGMQAINVALGGTLNQHIDNHRMLTRDCLPDSSRNHRVELSPNSQIAELLGLGTIETNSYHHQCIAEVAPGFVISGRAPDGTPEVIECEDRSYPCLGVQWHPEIDPTPVSLRLIQWMLDRARGTSPRRS